MGKMLAQQGLEVHNYTADRKQIPFQSSNINVFAIKEVHLFLLISKLLVYYAWNEKNLQNNSIFQNKINL